MHNVYIQIPKNEYIIIGSGKLIVDSSKTYYFYFSLNARMKRFPSEQYQEYQ